MQNKKLKEIIEKAYSLAKEKIISTAKFCRNIKWQELYKKLMNNPFEKILDFLTSWWHAIILFVAVLVFIYYPIGGLLVNNIDRNTGYEIKSDHPEQSATVEMMSFIIDREVNEKIWTPNLPFFFPSYFLDNMPSFQLGIFEALSETAVSFSKRIDKKIKVGQRQYLQEAAELLKYPGTVWMFSPENKLMPAPSANNQYRRARKRLIKFNQRLSEGSDVFYKSPADLAFFLVKIRRDLGSSLKTLETHIRENSSDWIDFKADNIFYYNQGKLYGYYLLLKAMGGDYKDIIVNTGQYQNWTKLLNTIEGGISINPIIVRNGELSSSTAPNHLSYLSFYTLKAQHLVSKISRSLEYNPQKR